MEMILHVHDLAYHILIIISHHTPPPSHHLTKYIIILIVGATAHDMEGIYTKRMLINNIRCTNKRVCVMLCKLYQHIYSHVVMSV